MWICVLCLGNGGPGRRQERRRTTEAGRLYGLPTAHGLDVGQGLGDFCGSRPSPLSFLRLWGHRPSQSWLQTHLSSQRSVSGGGSSYPKHASSVHRGRWSCFRWRTRGGLCARQVSTPGRRGCRWLPGAVKSAGLGNSLFEELS